MGVPISNVTRRVVYSASGTGPYNFTFEILASTDIAVYKDDTLLTLTTDYTVVINANGTGNITLTASPTGATQIAIVGNRTISRATDFVTGGDFFANTLNDELDQQTIFAQQNAEGLQRALQAPQTDPTSINMTLPRKTDRANKTLAFDANGNPTTGVSAADVANAVTYATNAANSATAAAASASSASASASSASGSASTATTQASNASTSASSASASASSASTSATNAASSASTATTQASNASTSATNAASSASAASTSASNAATSATNAANSASAASTSASNAATSESNAAASAAAAATALDNFDDRYLGAKSSDPTLDNDGNALVTGALYYRTTTPIGMRVYDGSQWLAASSAMQAAMVTYEYVATAGQTTFSGTDANGATLSYLAGSIVVTVNGVALRPGDDYTATNGTSIVLASAASLNDELIVLAFSSFNVANAIAKTGDTMTGSLLLPDGSASTVALGNDGDSNTGIFFPAADTVAVSTGGTERARVDSSGNVGIGTSPSTKLDVNGPSGNTSFTGTNAMAITVRGSTSSTDYSAIDFRSSAANSGSTAIGRIGVVAGGAGSSMSFGTSNSYANGITNTAMTIDPSGNVGIGTSSPSTYVASGGLALFNNYGTSSTAFAISNNSGYSASNIARIDFRLNNSFSGNERCAAIWGMNPNAGANNGGALVFGTSANGASTTPSEAMRIDSSGNLLVGTTSASCGGVDMRQHISASDFCFGLTATGGGASRQVARFSYSTTAVGSITVGASSTSYNTSSDYRLKENVQPMTGALATVAQLKPVTYTWKADGSAGQGFIAHELAEVCPHAVTGEKDAVDENGNPEYQGIDTSFLVATLTAAIQELKALNDAQASTITQLTERISALESAQ